MTNFRLSAHTGDPWVCAERIKQFLRCCCAEEKRPPSKMTIFLRFVPHARATTLIVIIESWTFTVRRMATLDTIR